MAASRDAPAAVAIVGVPFSWAADSAAFEARTDGIGFGAPFSLAVDAGAVTVGEAVRSAITPVAAPPIASATARRSLAPTPETGAAIPAAPAPAPPTPAAG